MPEAEEFEKFDDVAKKVQEKMRLHGCRLRWSDFKRNATSTA